MKQNSLKHVLTLLAGAVLLYVTATAAGRTPERGSSDAVSIPQNERRKLLASKLALIDTLTEHSAVAKRIKVSANSAAQQLMAEAKTAGAEARHLLAAGRDEAAENKVDTALLLVTEASRLVADANRIRRQEEQRYHELRQRIVSFREAFARVAAEKHDEQIPTLLDQRNIDRLLVNAQGLAAEREFGAANGKLESIAAAVETALSNARHQETLTHELKFDSPAEEYAYEQQRNKSYEMLIAMFQSQRPASHAARVNMEKMLERNERLRDDARALAERGETRAALEKLERATEYLVRTLKMSGLAFP